MFSSPSTVSPVLTVASSGVVVVSDVDVEAFSVSSLCLFELSPVSTDDVFAVLAEELEESNPFFFSSSVYVQTVAEWMALAA